MARVYQYYICLNYNFKDKLCSLFYSHSTPATATFILEGACDDWDCDKCYARCPCVFLLFPLFPSILRTNFPHFISLLVDLLFILPLVSISLQSILISFLPSFLISYSLSLFYPSSLHTFPSPLHPSQYVPTLAVYQASTLSSALRLMLRRCHPSPQCHHSAFKIQSFSETAVVHHLSSPPFWRWRRGTVGMAHWRPCLDIKQFGHLKHFNSDLFW